MARIGFYVRARDNAGNEGPLPSGSGSIQTWTTVDASAAAGFDEPPAALHEYHLFHRELAGHQGAAGIRHSLL